MKTYFWGGGGETQPYLGGRGKRGNILFWGEGNKITEGKENIGNGSTHPWGNSVMGETNLELNTLRGNKLANLVLHDTPLRKEKNLGTKETC